MLLKATPENVAVHEYLNSIVFGSIIRNNYKVLFEEILAVRNFLLSILPYTYTSRSVLAQKRRTLFLIVKFCMLQQSEFSEQRSNILHRTEHARRNIRINPSLALTPPVLHLSSLGNIFTTKHQRP
jgi:hypothetical protein